MFLGIDRRRWVFRVLFVSPLSLVTPPISQLFPFAVDRSERARAKSGVKTKIVGIVFLWYMCPAIRLVYCLFVTILALVLTR